MKNFSKIDRNFWEDDAARAMTPEEKYFWFYLQSNSKVNRLGCYKFGMKKAEDELGYSHDTIEKLLQKFVELGYILFDEETREVYLLAWKKDYWDKKSATIRALTTDLKYVESVTFLTILKGELEKEGILKGEKTAENQEKGTNGNNGEHLGTNGNKRGEEEEEEEEDKKESQKEKVLTCELPKKGQTAEPALQSKVLTSESSAFFAFWKAYPNKKNKKTAEKTWDKLKVTEELFAAIMRGLENAKRSLEWAKNGGEFIPHPATWLNAEGWENEYRTAGDGKPPAPHSPAPEGENALSRRRAMLGG